MPPARSSFTPLNIPDDAVPEWLGSFSLVAPPNTDLWRKPPARDTSTAPILYTALRNPFISAEVTVSADWELEWDQGGLVIFAGTPPGRIPVATPAADPPDVTSITLNETASTSPSPPSAAPPPSYAQSHPPTVKWVKVGLELSNNTPHASSVVATSDGADWSLTPLPASHICRTDLRLKIERIGVALWISYEAENVGWKKLREVTWFFWGVEDKAVRVGVYACRPANFGWSGAGAGGIGFGGRRRVDGWSGAGASGGGPVRNLCVDFEGLEIF